MKSYLKLFLSYGVCIGLSRSALFLSLPFLTKSLTIEEIGIVTLVQVVIGLLWPIVSLNGVAAIMREGLSDNVEGANFLRAYLPLPLLCMVGFLIVDFAISPMETNWIFLSLYLSCCFALLELLLTYFRSASRDTEFLLISLTRMLIFLPPAVFAMIFNCDVLQYLVLQMLVTSFIVVVVYCYFKVTTHEVISVGMSGIARVAHYTLPLIVQNAGHWAIRGSDRFVLLYFLGMAATGVYGLGYLLASPASIFNTALGFLIPRYFVTNYKEFATPQTRSKILIGVSGVTVFCNLLSCGVIITDYLTTQFIRHYHTDLVMATSVISAGVGMNCIYIVFGNFHFYHRKTRMLASSTAFAALFNLVLTVILVYWIGLLGAAYATVATYFVYLGIVYFGAQKLDGGAFTKIRIDAVIIFSALAVNLSIAVALSLLWKNYIFSI